MTQLAVALTIFGILIAYILVAGFFYRGYNTAEAALWLPTWIWRAISWPFAFAWRIGAERKTRRYHAELARATLKKEKGRGALP